jgi:glyoxylase-like metal-dependent hydrolase (beta-lactamase superfamily II)
MGFAQTFYQPQINCTSLDEHILIVKTGEVYPDQVVAISTDSGIVIIDSGISPTLSNEYRKIISQEFGRDDFKYLINTHHHFDHTNGNQVFGDAIIIAHDSCPVEMKKFSNSMDDFIDYRTQRYLRRDSLVKQIEPDSKMFKRLSDLVFTSEMMCNDLVNNYNLTLPEFLFDDLFILDLGNITMVLKYFGPDMHTNNDILVYIPEKAVLFTGDLLQEYENYSMIRSSHPINYWIASLERIFKTEKKIESIVTIHAGILPGERIYAMHEKLLILNEERSIKDSAIPRLEQQIYPGDVKNGISEFISWWEKNKNNYYLWEGDVNLLAREILEQGNIEDAISLFKLNTVLYPHSIDAVDWLAEAYMKAGENQKALKSLHRSMGLNPLNSWAADMIYSISN